MNIDKIIKQQGGVWTPDGWVVEGDLDLRGLKLTQLPKIHKVGGWFDCCDNQITTLEGAPHSVGDSFYCSYNQLTTLKGAPQTVFGSFDCSYNQLTTLDGMPTSISGIVYISFKYLNSFQILWLKANYKVEDR